jgi:hypothetical protein
MRIFGRALPSWPALAPARHPKADARREIDTALFLDPQLAKVRANRALLDWN